MMSLTDTSCTCSIQIWGSKWQTVDSCFGLVGPHQRRVCLVALRGPRLTYPKASSNGHGQGNETTLAPSHGKNVCAEHTKQTADSCFRLVGPHQHLRTLYVFCSQKVAKHAQKVLCNFLPSDTTWRSKTCRHS